MIQDKFLLDDKVFIDIQSMIPGYGTVIEIQDGRVSLQCPTTDGNDYKGWFETKHLYKLPAELKLDNLSLGDIRDLAAGKNIQLRMELET